MKIKMILVGMILLMVSPAWAMGDKELAAQVAKRAQVDKATAEKVIASFKEEVIAQLKAGEEVRLNDFGKFFAKSKDAHTAKNPKTGESVDVPAKNYLRFKAFKSGHAQLN